MQKRLKNCEKPSFYPSIKKDYLLEVVPAIQNKTFIWLDITYIRQRYINIQQ